MLFNSVEYWIFLILLLVVYHFTPRSWRTLLLFGASAYFYYSWNNFYLVIIAVSIIIDYVCGHYISLYRNRAKLLLWVSVVANIGLLFVFKYYAFLASVINEALLNLELVPFLQEHDLPFPVGISFYTFQTLSYTLDIYKRKRKPEPSLLTFSLYVLFFPQLLAGPIERSRKLLPQLKSLDATSIDNLVKGFRLILWGIFKKMVVADKVGDLVDQAYAFPEVFSGWPLWLATCMFTIQVYCDFSGYTDIAIGSARLFGIKLSNNFGNRVYFSTSISNFWKGWHITLTEWFRDYLYFSMVGKSRSKLTLNFSIILVFIVTGLWHGAGIGFIIWGFVNGIWIIIERTTAKARAAFFQQIGLFNYPRIFSVATITIVLSLQLFTSVWFITNSYFESMVILKLTLMNLFDYSGIPWQFSSLVVALVPFIFMDLINVKMQDKRFEEWMSMISPAQRFLVYFILVELIVSFGNFGNDDFFYFQF